MHMTLKARRLLLLVLLLPAVALLLLLALFRDEIFPESSPASRGARLAVRAGCFSCHGDGGNSGVPNPSAEEALEIRRVPTLTSERHSVAQLRQWIANGISDAKKSSQARLAARQRKAIEMPAFADRLSGGEIDDLSAYVALLQYSANLDEESLSDGERLARRFSCFSCHGGLGQGGVLNPGSLKGYVPGFFGADFDALTRGGDRQDIREWILQGASQAFLDRTLLGVSPGHYFSQRQAIQMPAYERFLTEEQIEALIDYLLELRRGGALDASAVLRLPAGESNEGDREQPTTPSPYDAGEQDPSPTPSGDAAAPDSRNDAPEPPQPVQDFSLFYRSRDILRRCLRCHGPTEQKSGYRLETRRDAIRGGEIASLTGTQAVFPGDASQGLMMTFIQALEEDAFNEIYPMPPKGTRLTPEEIEIVRRWIASGFLWPPGADLLPVE